MFSFIPHPCCQSLAEAGAYFRVLSGQVMLLVRVAALVVQFFLAANSVNDVLPIRFPDGDKVLAGAVEIGAVGMAWGEDALPLPRASSRNAQQIGDRRIEIDVPAD